MLQWLNKLHYSYLFFLTHSNASTEADEQLTEEFARAMQSVKDGQVIFKSKEDIFLDQLDMLGNTDSPWYSTSQSFIIPVGSVLITLLTIVTVSYTHLRAHETPEHLVCRLLLEKKN